MSDASPSPFNFDALLDAIDGPALDRKVPQLATLVQGPVPTLDEPTPVSPKREEPEPVPGGERRCDVYTPFALRDAFFGVAGVRAQVARSSACSAYAARCVLVSKLVHVEFRVPDAAAIGGAEPTLSVHVGSLYEAALDGECAFASGARATERELRERFSASEAAATLAKGPVPVPVDTSAWARAAALRQLVLPASGAECLGGETTYESAVTGSASVRQLDATRCVFEAADVVALENDTGSDVVALCSLQGAMHALVRFVEGHEDTSASASANGATAAARGRVERSSPLGEPLALARAGAHLCDEALSLARVRPAYFAQHAYVSTFSNMSVERLLAGTLDGVRAPGAGAGAGAGDDGLLVPEKLALGFFITRNPHLFNVEMRLRESPDDVLERERVAREREERERPVRERRSKEMQAEFERLRAACVRAEAERDAAAVAHGAHVVAGASDIGARTNTSVTGPRTSMAEAARVLAEAEARLASLKETERRARNAEDGGARSRQEALERKEAAITSQKKRRFAHVERALALDAARMLVQKTESEIPWSNPLALQLAVRPVGDRWLPEDAGKCVRLGVRVWYTLAPQQGALDAIVWTAL